MFFHRLLRSAIAAWLLTALVVVPARAEVDDSSQAGAVEPELQPSEEPGDVLGLRQKPAGGLVGGFGRTSKIVTLALVGGAITVLGTSDTETIEEIGDILQWALPAAALGTTYLADDERGRRDFVKSVGTSTLTVFALKEALDKARPNAEGLNSFPSGHTAAAFSGASFVNLRYGPRWGVPALVLAGYTGASRIYAEKHFLDDVISGMSISLLANRYFVFPIENGFELLPTASKGSTGLAVRWKGSGRRWSSRSFDSPELQPERGFRYEWEFGGTAVDINDVATPSASGGSSDDAFSFLFDEANNPTVTARVEVGYTPKEKPRQELVLQVAPFEVRDFGRFSVTTDFAGTLVPAGEELRTQYLLYDYRLRYRFLMRPNKRLCLHAGVGLAFQDIVTTLTWTDDEVEIEEGNFIPFLHLDAEIGMTNRLRLSLEADVGRSAEDRLSDASIGLRYRVHPRWDLGGGIRRIERTIVTDQLRNELERDQFVLAIGYSF